MDSKYYTPAKGEGPGCGSSPAPPEVGWEKNKRRHDIEKREKKKRKKKKTPFTAISLLPGR